MAIKSKRWEISPALPESAKRTFADYPDVHPVIAQILYNRGFTDPQSALAFVRGDVTFGDPFKMEGMAKAVSRLRDAIKRKESIVVYGDFDADGVTSTTLLVTALKALGANVRPYIPHRVDEGYGLNNDALIKLAKQGAQVVVTVDCGIRSVAEVEVGQQAGLSMIVTDHHSVGPELPHAWAVINPKQAGCKYPEKMLAGVGVTYKLVEALWKATTANSRHEPPFPVTDLLDLVAIGTVADLVPLDSAENRKLVIEGLKVLRKANRLGLRALMEVAGITPAQISATNIGFIIGPRINAAGRLESAMTAYHLLSTDDRIEAATHAQKLQELNETRQKLTRDMQEYARTLAGVESGDVPLIFAADANFKQGIVGLVAGRLTEEFYRPSIVIQRGEEESHGSCRSILEFNITEALDQCADLLIRHGGHAQAAGFAIHNDNLPEFRGRMQEIATNKLTGQDLRPHLTVDAVVPLHHLNMRLHDALSSLEPCGHGYPAPILATRKLRVVDCRTVGKDGAHLKLKLTDGSLEQDAIAFRFGDMLHDLPPVVDVAYSLEVNEWNGNRTLQLNVSDIRAPA
ncbi:MAG: single-stranded-DNA-specific exonuclease RecJ [Anaerolineae bacterium]|nr:single-stranded-DNA-specific exonuclease RecJ [Anaerolineae bacterium]